MKQVRNHSCARRRAARLAGTAGLALLTVACGSSPSSGGSPAASGGSSPSASPGLVAFAQCMRAHGINLSGIDLNSPQFQAAKQACRQYQIPNGKG